MILYTIWLCGFAISALLFAYGIPPALEQAKRENPEIGELDTYVYVGALIVSILWFVVLPLTLFLPRKKGL